MKEGEQKINMQLKCNIKGKEYNLVQGIPFKEEYSETLDSASIVLSHIEKIKDLKPYDDIFIYDNKFLGYNNSEENYREIKISWNKDENNGKIGIFLEYLGLEELLTENYNQKIYINFIKIEDLSSITLNFKLFSEEKGIIKLKNLDYDIFPNIDVLEFDLLFSEYGIYGYSEKQEGDLGILKINESKSKILLYKENSNPKLYNKFYKHLLVDRYSSDILNLQKKIHTYKIELFSETKGLEIIQLPNISITQPLKYNKKKSVWRYLNDFVEMYSPKIKMVSNSSKNTWQYVNKYKLSPSLKDIFENVYAPDFSLNSPNLRDLLSKLMIVKDMIPYVEDDVIYAMDLTETKNEININDKDINYISQNLTSDNYCDNLKRTYSNALSQDTTARKIETLTFRNSDTSLLTLENMRLETSFPIYKINNLKVNYLKKINVIYSDGETDIFPMIVTHDITPIVKLDYEVGWLNPDWTDLVKSKPKTLDELSKYTVGVVSYSMGSNYISGWGKKYSYIPSGKNDVILSWWTKESTYLENILKVLKNNEYGENGTQQFINLIEEKYNKKVVGISSSGEDTETDLDQMPSYGSSSSLPLNMKGFFFTIDYNAFYNGTVIHSKDNGLDNVTINDNQSSSLTLLESDGLFQKEKINRFGNEAYLITARHNDIFSIYNNGDYFYDDDDKNKEEKIIIYHKEYSIENNFINAKYFAMKDYVLKNYFTTVFAKHRTYNLMSYSESVIRSENKKMFLLLSKKEQYYENDIPFQFINFNNFYLSSFLSFYKSNPIDKTSGLVSFSDKIDFGYIKTIDEQKYICDVNSFICGNSLCFNIKMFDNASAGVYINKRTPNLSLTLTNTDDDYTGSLQKYYLIVDDEETGFIEKLGIYVSNYSDFKNKIQNQAFYFSGGELIYDFLDNFPKITEGVLDKEIQNKNVIGNDFKINKDNKELIDMTYQFEPITNDKNILFSSWIMKLCDLNGSFAKFSEKTLNTNSTMYTGLFESNIFFVKTYLPLGAADIYGGVFFVLKIKKEDIEKIYNEHPNEDIYLSNFEKTFNWSDKVLLKDKIKTLSYNLKRIKISKTDEKYEILSMDLAEKFSFSRSHWFSYDIIERSHFNEEAYTFKQISSDYKIDGFIPVKIEDYNDDYLYFGMQINSLTFRVQSETEDLHFELEQADFDEAYKLWEGIEDFSLNDDMLKKCEYKVGVSFPYKVFDKNLYVVLSKEEMKKTIVYDEKLLNQIEDSNLKAEDIFDVSSGPEGDLFEGEKVENFLSINLKDIKEGTRSIQLWYNHNNSLKFVFGVNITDEDLTKNKIYIYLSLITNRDKRIYDNNHNIVGENFNYVNSNRFISDKEQYYSKKNDKD